MAKEIIMGIDIADHWWIGIERGLLYGEQPMRELIRTCAETGINTLYWRVDCVGRVSYRSHVRARLGEQLDRLATPLSLNQTMTQELFRSAAVETLILNQCDPLAIAVEEAHRCGMKIHAYMTLFDEYFPGGAESRFEIEHPQFTWKHRFSNHHIRGLLSYFYPEVREHRLAQVKELLSYPLDGIYLDVARTHSGVQQVTAMPLTGGDPYAFYGYNPEEVAAFREEFKHDPPPTDAFAASADEYHRFRGGFLTQFLREVRSETNRKGVRLGCGLYTDAACYLSPAGRRGRVPLGRFFHDVDTWWKDDLVDAFVIFCEHRRFGAKDWREHTGPQFSDARKAGKHAYVQVSAHYEIHEMENPPVPLPITIEKDRAAFIEGLKRGIHASIATSADGVYIYDAFFPERYNYWKELKAILAKG